MATQFLDRARMSVSSAPGTGAVALGAATTGNQSFAAAGAANGSTISYAIEDGANWEIGHGTYSTTGPTLARTTIIASNNGGAAINASANAIVYATFLAEDVGSSGNAPGNPRVVQNSAVSEANGTNTSAFALAPTPGNLIVCIGVYNSTASVGYYNTPSGNLGGWTVLSQANSVSLNQFILIRTAVAGDTQYTAPLGSFTAACIYYEVANISGAGANVDIFTQSGGALSGTLTNVPANSLIVGAMMSTDNSTGSLSGVTLDSTANVAQFYVQGFHEQPTSQGSVTLAPSFTGGNQFEALAALVLNVSTGGVSSYSAQRLRIGIPRFSGYYSVAISEIQLVDANGNQIPWPSGTTFSASEQDSGQPAANAFDGSASTYFSFSNSGGPEDSVDTSLTIEADMPSKITGIYGVAVTARNDNSGAASQCPPSFTIMLSPDTGTEYTAGYAITGPAFGVGERRVIMLPSK